MLSLQEFLFVSCCHLQVQNFITIVLMKFWRWYGISVHIADACLAIWLNSTLRRQKENVLCRCRVSTCINFKCHYKVKYLKVILLNHKLWSIIVKKIKMIFSGINSTMTIGNVYPTYPIAYSYTVRPYITIMQGWKRWFFKLWVFCFKKGRFFWFLWVFLYWFFSYNFFAQTIRLLFLYYNFLFFFLIYMNLHSL